MSNNLFVIGGLQTGKKNAERGGGENFARNIYVAFLRRRFLKLRLLSQNFVPYLVEIILCDKSRGSNPHEN